MTKDLFTLCEGLSKREISSVELVRECLENIEKKDAAVGAFLSVCADDALRSAEDIDSRRAAGEELPLLAGIPYGVKDNICVKGYPMTCASRMLEDFIAPYDATVIRRLKEQGTVVLGKLNMDEFAMGSATDTSYFKTTKNPLDTTRTAGGSSGGSAAAVAAEEAIFTLGTDTGGSCRQPAAFCGGVALKPTYGTVPRYGAVAFASSFDQICPMSADVRGNAMIADAIMGSDPRDLTSRERGDSCVSQIGRDVKGLRIALALPEGEVTPDVYEALSLTARRFEQMGAVIEPIKLPDSDVALATYYVLTSAEASSNLARFDGVRYGHRAEGAQGIDELITRSRSEGFGKDVKRRIMLGSFVLSRAGRDGYYKRALTARAEIRRYLCDVLSRADVIMLPVAPSVAPKFRTKPQAPLEGYKGDCFCVLANISGLPSVSVPCGIGEGGMPVGVQLMGAELSEAMLYRVAYALEQDILGGGAGK